MKVNKKLKFIIKFVVSLIVWSLIYFLCIMPFLGVLFHFNFLALDAWQEKWLAFVNYNWRIRSLPDVLLVIMMIAWIPLYFIGLFLFLKTKWTIFVFKPKPKTVVKRALDIKKDKPQYAKPRVMPSTIQMTKYVAPQLPGQEKKAEQTTGNKSHKNVLQMIKQMAVVARKFQVEIFQHILLEGFRVPMAISTAARAMMIEIVNAKDANWSVDCTDDVLESGWYSGDTVMEKMALDLVKASEALEKAEPGSEVVKVICLTDGRILNAKQTVEYFKKYNIHLICFNNGQPKTDIIDYASFVASYFDLKEGETDPSLVKLDKVPLVKNAKNETPTPEKNVEQEKEDNVKSETETVQTKISENKSEKTSKESSSTSENNISETANLPEQKLMDEDSSDEDPKIVTAVAKG